LLSFGILFVQIDHSEWGEKHRNESGTHPKKNMWNGWGLLWKSSISCTHKSPKFPTSSVFFFKFDLG